MKNLILLLLCLLTFTAHAEVEVPQNIEGALTITAEELFALRKNPKTTLLDVRRKVDYTAAHLPGAVHLLSTKITRVSLKAATHSKAAPLVIYCQGITCRRAAEATKDAAQFGYKNLYYYYGGIDDWTALGWPLQTGADT